MKPTLAVPSLIKVGDFFIAPDNNIWRTLEPQGTLWLAVKVFCRDTNTLPTGQINQTFRTAQMWPVKRVWVLNKLRRAVPHNRGDLQAKALDLKRVLVFGQKSRCQWKGK